MDEENVTKGRGHDREATPAGAGRLLPVAVVAEWWGRSHRETRRQLGILQGLHGGLLLRHQGRRTKLWVVEERLYELVPSLMRKSRRDLAVLRTQVDQLQLAVERNQGTARSAERSAENALHRVSALEHQLERAKSRIAELERKVERLEGKGAMTDDRTATDQTTGRREPGPSGGESAGVPDALPRI